jgi:predicted permease
MSWGRFFRRAKWDRERRTEIDSYLQIETDENMALGMTEEDARAAAHRKLGNSTRVREEIYAMNTITLLDSIAGDVRQALRMLRRSHTFTAVALLTLAIGIGANTAVFSVVNSVLIKPLPYPESDRLVAVWHKAPGAPGLASVSGDLRLSDSMYFTYAEQNRTFQSLGVWVAGSSTVTGMGEPERVRSVFVSDGALQTLDVGPMLGRWLSREDQVPGGRRTVVLGYGYWQRRFGGDRSVIGRNVTVDSRSWEIVGVMPPGFQFVDTPADLILPLAFDRGKAMLPGFGYQCLARLKSGVTIEQASADIARLVPIWMTSWPTVPGVNPRVYENWRITPALRPLKQDVTRGVASVLWVVLGTIGLVMLIVCANVANLMLVRTEARQQELAVRAALGAGRGRISRELLVESMLLALIGGALGVALAEAGLRLLVAMGPGNLPRLSEIAVDARALGFTLGLSLASGILFGLIPAFKYAGPGISDTLRGGGRTVSQSRERHRARNLLVIGQLALALVLLVSAGLMIRTFQALLDVQPGFAQPEEVQLVKIAIPRSMIAEPERVIRMQNDILDRLAAIPGVSSVGFASQAPMEGLPPGWDVIIKEGQADLNGQIPPLRMFQRVSPGFFPTLGIKMIAGRDYTWADLYGRRPVAIVSENLARELWGTPAAAVGKRLSTGLPKSPWREVVGVVENVRQNGVQETAPAIVYWPSYAESLYSAGRLDVERFTTIAIRSRRAGNPSFLNQVRQAVWSVNATLPLASVRTMRDLVAQSLARASFTLTMLGIAGGIALILGVVGVYGVISYAVSQRRREIGIRVALGARPGEMSRMFVRYGLKLAGMGVAIGLAAAAGLMQLMQSALFGISALDPLTYVGMTCVLTAAAVLSSYLPARRAAGVDPMTALKEE